MITEPLIPVLPGGLAQVDPDWSEEEDAAIQGSGSLPLPSDES